MLNQVTQYLLNAEVRAISHIDSDITFLFKEVKLWIATSWRIENGDGILVGSGDLVEYLSHDDYKDDYEDSLQLIRDLLCKASITSVSYSNWNELIVGFDNGHTFRSFQETGEDAENFQLYIHRERYLAYPNRIDLEELHQFYKS